MQSGYSKIDIAKILRQELLKSYNEDAPAHAGASSLFSKYETQYTVLMNSSCTLQSLVLLTLFNPLNPFDGLSETRRGGGIQAWALWTADNGRMLVSILLIEAGAFKLCLLYLT